ncbi:winged helix DNA-binding domain-containing protein [Microtetraspora fusca]|uniref:winged helix DNA-binding domain-containing protein n=1 Tax=Microtetraspora fusca TaxID=1997 RepID=UPI00147142C9|nr:winged helix DNA-binding domain-containing protein [Microtetraspora fusca]
MNTGSTGTEDVRARRVRAQLLDRSGNGGAVGVVRHLLAVQAQDPGAFPLALRARMSGLTAWELTATREAGAVVRCWGPRGTLHLIAADDLDWLYPLVKPAPAGSLRRLRQLGVDTDTDRAVSVTESALAGQGPLTKPELGGRLTEAGLPAQGQAIVHLAMLSAGSGKVVLGPERDGKATYVHAGDWLGSPVPTDVPDRETAMRKLVVRYRRAHDPAGPPDLAAWSGLPLREVERAWREAPDSAEEDPRSQPGREPVVRLVPGFDEYLLGWRSREHAVPAPYRALIHPGGGVIRSALLLDGRAAGTWRTRRTAGRIDITVEPFEPLPKAVLPALAAETEDIGVFLGLDTRLTVME